MAAQQDAVGSGNEQVQELPGEEESQGYDETQQDILRANPSGGILRANDNSLLSA